MKNAVFVSKDHEEYNRYAKSINDTKFNDLSISTGTELSTSQDDQEIPGGNSGIGQTPIVGKSIQISDDIKVFVIDGDKLPSKQKFCIGEAKLEEFLKEMISIVRTKENLRLFVHWGNGGTEENVARIEQMIDGEFQSISDENINGILSIQSISSKRDRYFKISTEEIVPPCTAKGIEDLYRDLIQAQKDALPPSYQAEIDIGKIEEINLGKCKFKVVIIPMSNTPRLINTGSTTGCFIATLKEWLKKRFAFDVSELEAFLETKSEETESKYPIPLFVYDKWSPKSMPYEKWGLMAPKELLVEFDYGLEKCIYEDLESRFKYWIDHNNEIWADNEILNNLRDWLSGTFRKYAFQDEHVHGSSSLMDLHKLNGSQEDIDDFIEHWILESQPSDKYSQDKAILKCRFLGGNPILLDEMSFLAPVLKIVYKKEIENIKKAIYCIRNIYKTNKDSASLVARVIFRDSAWTTGIWRDDASAPEELGDAVTANKGIMYGNDQGAIVSSKGTAIRYASSTLQFNVLVIDDNPKTKEDLKDLQNVFCFKLFTGNIYEGSIKNRVKELIGKINSDILAKHLSYDFVLLDLSLGESSGSDLTGYHIIPIIHQFFPQLPIIIYSQFSDMGHIARAFRCGAKWFLKKGEEEKLPRHIFSLMRRMEWEKEWNVVNKQLWHWEQRKVETRRQQEFYDRFNTNEKWQYLVYKSMEKYPGVNVEINPMGEGFSTAATFQAVKCEPGKKPVQTPVIIKIDNVYNTRLEYERYFRFIRPYIANRSGRIEEPELVLDDENSAIVYSFAGRQSERYDLNTMSNMLRRDIKNRSSCDFESYGKAFEIILSDILPRIHNVKPNLEFNNEAAEINETPSGFPNRFFGEVRVGSKKNEDISKEDFLANWLCRMPLCRTLDDREFIAQDKADPEKTAHYEFNKKYNVEGKCYIEALDFKDKCKVVMKGDTVTHVVKYRPYIYPCMTLWVDKKCDNKIQLEDSIHDKVITAIKELDLGLNDEQAKNEFANIVKELIKDPISAGRPSDEFFQLKDKNTIKDWNKAFNEIDNRKETAFNALPALLEVAKNLLNGDLKEKLMDCPAGIVHGDMNYSNIMLETKKRFLGRAVFSDEMPEVKDVWLIDFARTRRDLIAHDFNVLFTSTLALLFDLDIWKSEETIAHDVIYKSLYPDRNFGLGRSRVKDKFAYHSFIETIFREFIVRAVFDKLDATPDFIEQDKRLSFIFRILRRIRMAALKAGMSEESYAFTTALSCMVASQVYIDHDKNAPAAAAMIATAFICLAKLNSYGNK